MLFFDNLIPHKFLPEILEVIEIVKVKRKDWFFIILFGNDDYFFEDLLGISQNVTRELVHFNAPDYVRDLINKKKYIKKLNISFIWLPKKTLSNETSNLEEKIHFFWHLIHELQHLKQDETYGIGNTELDSFLGKYFFERIKNTLEVQLHLPVELDAEMKAKKIIVHKFKEEGFLEYLRFRINQNQENKSYYEKIKKIDSNYNFNIKNETLKLLISEKVSLKKKLKEFQVQGKYTDIDIDAICKSGDIWGK